MSEAEVRPPLTADLAARAIIAAAVKYGDDPVVALTADKAAGPFARRCLTPAASAMARECEISMARVGPILGVSGAAIGVARAKGRPGFVAAETSAREALRYALQWQAFGVSPGETVALRGAASFDPRPLPTTAHLGVYVPPRPTPQGAVKVVPVERPAPPPPARRFIAAVLDEAAPPVSGPVLRPPPRSAPPVGVSSARAPMPTPATSLEGRILAFLTEAGSATTPTLATRLDAKEAGVCSALSVMLSEGRVAADPLPPEGLRAQRWRVAS